MRKTKNRSLVLEIIENSNNPISAITINEIIEQKGYRKMHVSTIYRAISWLIENNLITEELEGNLGEKLYSKVNKEHNHYIKCIHCNEMEKIKLCPLHHLEEDIKKKTKFNILSHKLVFEGICDKCIDKED